MNQIIEVGHLFELRSVVEKRLIEVRGMEAISQIAARIAHDLRELLTNTAELLRQIHRRACEDANRRSGAYELVVERAVALVHGVLRLLELLASLPAMHPYLPGPRQPVRAATAPC